MSCPNKSLPIVELSGKPRGLPQFWRSLEELAGDPAFEERLAHEFPRHASAWDPAVADRRRFMQLMAASLALAGAQGCSPQPPETIMPYVRQPEEITQGEPLYFATAMPGPEGALGLVVTSRMGRPVKVEGNPLHPASLGATDAFAQASVLSLYDPDRSQTVTHVGIISTWGALLGAVRQALDAAPTGAGIHVLSPPINSPTLARQRAALLEARPEARWYTYDPAGRDGGLAAVQAALGEAVRPIYQFANADVVLAIDADFLCSSGGGVRYARDFMSRRGAESEGNVNRLYSIETAYTPTGAAADHRLPLSPSGIERFTRALAARLGAEAAGEAPELDEAEGKWLDTIAADLEQNRGRSAVVAGEHQTASVHVLVHAMNEALGNVGATVTYLPPFVEEPPNGGSLRELVDALNADQVNMLVVLDANPVYDAPGDLKFAEAIRKAKEAIHFGLFEDETAELCHWHIPAAHYLESWSDARAYDGTAAIVQPLIAPLYDGRTVHEVLSPLVDSAPQTSYDIVRATWQQEFGEGMNERWQAALRDGLIAGSQPAAATPELQADAFGGLLTQSELAEEGDKDSFEVLLVADPSIGDGRFANNGWLQELPKPLTKLTWENAVMISPADAERRGIETDDVVTLTCNERTITAPACIMPGHAEGALTCYLGYGRTRAGRVGTNLGFNAYTLRRSEGGYIARGATLERTGRRSELARTQKHFNIDGRNIVHQATVDEFEADHHSVLPASAHHPLPSLLPEYKYEGFAWGMAIDLTKCIGCNACVAACNAENNIPVVGKEGVIRSREMHWLRLDTYYLGEPDNPGSVTQPMLCQHCEKAPCEVVCPVAATTHSSEGLNEMTYNRCIGTRYCSNNCPYKVRRFNYFQYVNEDVPVLKLLRNPEVTVRSRGVMEKCTYCVQRINNARIEAKIDAVNSGERAAIADGTLQTACQQACPTQAIVFGDINDPSSRVAKLKADPRNYGVLDELGTQPRTSYLVRLRNPNPALA